MGRLIARPLRPVQVTGVNVVTKDSWGGSEVVFNERCSVNQGGGRGCGKSPSLQQQHRPSSPGEMACKAGLKINLSFPGFWAGPWLEKQVSQPLFTPQTCLKVLTGHTALGTRYSPVVRWSWLLPLKRADCVHVFPAQASMISL